MSYPFSFSPKGQFFLFLLGALLANTPAGASCEKKSYYPSPLSHISSIYPLYISRDTGWLKLPDGSPEMPASRYIRREKNSALVIALPDAARGKYRLRFWDGDNHMVFEIRNIRDSMLIVEKYNFQRAGTFQYELFKNNILLEKNTFIIKKD
jgi:hypothetical protein